MCKTKFFICMVTGIAVRDVLILDRHLIDGKNIEMICKICLVRIFGLLTLNIYNFYIVWHHCDMQSVYYISFYILHSQFRFTLIRRIRMTSLSVSSLLYNVQLYSFVVTRAVSNSSRFVFLFLTSNFVCGHTVLIF